MGGLTVICLPLGGTPVRIGKAVQIVTANREAVRSPSSLGPTPKPETLNLQFKGNNWHLLLAIGIHSCIHSFEPGWI